MDAAAIDAANAGGGSLQAAGTATEGGASLASNAAADAAAEGLNPMDFGASESAQTFPVREGMLQESAFMADGADAASNSSALATSDGMLPSWQADPPSSLTAGLENESLLGGSLTNTPANVGGNTITGSAVDPSGLDQAYIDSANASPLKLANTTKTPGEMLDGLSKWLKNNKEMTDIALKGLAAATDPRAKYLEKQQALLNQRVNNLNSPIRLGIVKG